MIKPRHEIAEVLNDIWNQIAASGYFNGYQLRILNALKKCRTAALGGHVDACDQCGFIRISYNSCGNRHCPKCQGTKREKWVQARENDLLPVPYFHIVFTIPSALNDNCLAYPRQAYNALFQAGWDTINAFACDPKHMGAETGMVAVLHTWGQNLSVHPHLHCIVPAGGLKNGRWKYAKSKGKYLFPVKSLSKVFRAKYLSALRTNLKPSNPSLSKKVLDILFEKPWVVYAKQPFLGPQQVIEYLGRYTHKIAISNHRIQDIDNHHVTFKYKDYKNIAKTKIMKLTKFEFIRRFSLHILPKYFVRIRHFGILSSRKKSTSITLIRKQIGVTAIKQKPFVISNPCLCPCCKHGKMITVTHFGTRGPPAIFTLSKLHPINRNFNP